MVFVSERLVSVSEYQDAAKNRPYNLTIPPTAKKEKILENTNQNTMVGILTQLSVLAQYSSELYSNLLSESSSVYERLSSLTKRVAIAQQTIPQVEDIITKTSIEANCSNPRSDNNPAAIIDAQKFTVESRPKPIADRYTQCFLPPALSKMDPYMDNGQKCLELYTNPRFFLDEWIQEQMKLRAAAKEERRKRREERKKQREAEGTAGKANKGLGPAKPKKMERVMYDPNTGEKIIVRRETDSDSGPSLAQSTLKSPSGSHVPAAVQAPPPPVQHQGPAPMSRQPSNTPPPPAPTVNMTPPPVTYNTVPAPPPNFPAAQDFGHHHHHQPAPVRKPSEQPVNIPAAPAPPPPPAFGAPPPPPGVPPPPDAPSFGEGLAAQLSTVGLRSVGAPAPKKVDARSDLLQSIKSGIALKSAASRTVPQKEVEQESSSVASILARRIAIAPSDSEDDDSDDDAGWD